MTRKIELEIEDELNACCGSPDLWSRKAILKVASSGKFPSNRTIREYAEQIWNLKPSPVG
jgi:glycogen phosphorylase